MQELKNQKHYKLNIDGKEINSIEVVKAVLGEEGFRKFCQGNALKYVVRAEEKNGVEDYKKAVVYLNWLTGEDPNEKLNECQDSLNTFLDRNIELEMENEMQRNRIYNLNLELNNIKKMELRGKTIETWIEENKSVIVKGV